jgi:hypothetical protein
MLWVTLLLKAKTWHPKRVPCPWEVGESFEARFKELQLGSFFETYKVETPYCDNGLFLTPIKSPHNGWQWTWSCSKLHMGGFSDGGWQFRNLGGVTRWNSQFLIHTSTFIAIICVSLELLLCLFWIKSTAWNRCYNTLASKICVILLKPPKSQIPTPNTSFRIC